MLRKIIYLFFSLLFSVLLVFFQRKTGPTYPVKGSFDIYNDNIKYFFPRSCTIKEQKCNAVIDSKVGDFYIKYKRYKINEEFKIIRFSFVDSNKKFIANIPSDFPPAAKIEYNVYAKIGENEFKINNKSVILRFKNKVDSWILIIHVIIMFGSLVLSLYMFFRVIFDKKYSSLLLYINWILLLIGGFVFGGLLQKQAFGLWWSGFPLGYDITDNKTLIVFLSWSVALLFSIRKKNVSKYIVFSSILMILSYLIPHSLFGSEYDYLNEKIR
ncbi:MAG: hypothetical protein N2446_01535 [Elusimicrobiales bacterium]|nr:hypothetical protein [Elusimicrobiales bacterium]